MYDVQLYADVLNSQHAGTAATWRISIDIVIPEQHRQLANECEDIDNLQRAEPYCHHVHSLLFTQALWLPWTGWIIVAQLLIIALSESLRNGGEKCSLGFLSSEL